MRLVERAAGAGVRRHLVAVREMTGTLSAMSSSLESQEKVEERNIENIEWFLSQALYPDETLLNHYAVMIYTSADNGRIFEELEGATVCDSCGQKVRDTHNMLYRAGWTQQKIVVCKLQGGDRGSRILAV